MKKRLICLLLLGVCLQAQTQAPRVKERLRLIHADSLVSLVVHEQEVVHLIGAVRLIQGEAHLSCDNARLWQKDDRALLTGRVKIFDGKRTLYADRVDYNGILKQETATGRVKLISGSRELTSRRLVYRQEKETADAEGDVVFHDHIEQATLTGGKAFYDRAGEYSRVEIHPRLVKVDSTSLDSLVVTGELMEAWGKREMVLVTDSVTINQGDMSAQCSRAIYRSGADSLFLEIEPEVQQGGQTMNGDAIAIDLRETRFQGGRILGNARVFSKVRSFEDVMTGKTITLVADRDTLRQVIVDGQASSIYHIFDEDSLYQGVNNITGDQITLTFEAGKVNHIEVASDPGDSEGLFKPDNKKKPEAEKTSPAQEEPPAPEQTNTETENTESNEE